MTLSSTDPSLPRLARRRFLASAAAGAALWQCGQRAFSEITGPVVPKLAAYDELMTAFMREHKPPGAALAVAYHGRLVYARGFGYADVERREPMRPAALFRIASISKPFTAATVMQLIQQGKLHLDERVLPLLKLEPHLERGTHMDPRWHRITVRQCLQHTAGCNRDKSFDPMSAQTAEQVAKALRVSLPIHPKQIISYTMGKPLDFDPGTAYVYSNFGYCVLGRVIEAVTGKAYHEVVRERILARVGIRNMQLGKNLLKDRAPGEVKYYDRSQRTGRAISGPKIGAEAPLPYGVECIETMDANGGWIASAVDLVRFATALDDPKRCPILTEESIRTMLAPPPGAVGHGPKGRPKESYYACGWDVRPAAQADKYTKWHGGLLAGSSTLLVCRDDGIDWAVLFNRDAGKDGKEYAGLIDPLLHKPANEIKDWPEADLFSRF
ncbi:MAG: serine hydrolase domain-containing protein [Thermoguttaceae bacterium]